MPSPRARGLPGWGSPWGFTHVIKSLGFPGEVSVGLGETGIVITHLSLITQEKTTVCYVHRHTTQIDLDCGS